MDERESPLGGIDEPGVAYMTSGPGIRTLVAAMVAKPQPRPSETVLALLTYSMVPSWFVTQSTGSQAEILEKFRDRFREGARK